MFGKKKKQETAVWELEEVYQTMKADFKENFEKWTTEERRTKLQELLTLDKQRLEWEKEHKPEPKRHVSPDGWLAAGVTLAASAAPYAIEKGGHLASHLKTKVQLPKIWK
jgi:hypothetical protein